MEWTRHGGVEEVWVRDVVKVCRPSETHGGWTIRVVDGSDQSVPTVLEITGGAHADACGPVVMPVEGWDQFARDVEAALRLSGRLG